MIHAAPDLSKIFPWGRTAAEYERMFALGEREKKMKILGCGDGPASFNVEWTRLGRAVVSVDPVYIHPAGAIAQRIDESAPQIMANMRANLDAFIWDEIGSPEELEARRCGAMSLFIEDFAAGRGEGRYVAGKLPSLPFEPSSFDLALVSHLLFLYSEVLDWQFHADAIKNLVSIASEVRIFPLLTMNGAPSPHLECLLQWAGREGLNCEITNVDYEFQRDGNRMLRITNKRD